MATPAGPASKLAAKLEKREFVTIVELSGPDIEAAQRCSKAGVDAIGLPSRMRSQSLAASHAIQQEGGIEALVGVVNDPTFGPLVVCGLGGVQAELLRDVSFRLPPVTDTDAAEMIDRLRLRTLLDGYRAAPAGDRPALIELLQRVSALVEALPELYELDLNPVKILPPGEGLTVVDARIRLGPARLGPF